MFLGVELSGRSTKESLMRFGAFDCSLDLFDPISVGLNLMRPLEEEDLCLESALVKPVNC